MCACSCTTRTKVLLAGASDMIVGGAGVVGFGIVAILVRAIVFDGGVRPFLRVNWDSMSMVFLGIFLSGLVMGICTISAVTYKNNCCLFISTILRSFWVLFWLYLSASVFVLVLWYGGYSHPYLAAVLFVLIPGMYSIAQLYFLQLIVLDYYHKNEDVNLTEGEGRRGGEKPASPTTTTSTTEPEFAPITPPQSGEQDKV